MEIEELKKQILAANKAYRDGHPTMSDQDFDNLCEELEKRIPIEEYCLNTGLEWNEDVRNSISYKTKVMGAEIIREKALICLDDEIPHGIQVVVTAYNEDENPIAIDADIYCEKDSHKAIILGKNGEMIKKIGTLARKSIEHLIDSHVNLNLFVKTRKDWRNNIKDIEEFGLSASE